MKDIQSMSEHLASAEINRKGVSPLTELVPDLTEEQAYQIQLKTIDRKVKEGQHIVGKKIGLTSLAMQNMLGVNQPDYGHLLDGMWVENGGVISFDRVLQPKVEGEIAFVLRRDLAGPGVTTLDVLRATECVIPALEIVDSRIMDWKIKLSDTVADNASSGLFVLGRPHKVDEIDLTLEGMVFYKNGEIVNTGTGAAALGNPATCVAWLANKLSSFGIVLKAGEIILSGAVTAAANAQPGDHFSARFTHLGEVGVRFINGQSR
jgi:2-keto-4-pentenoate hydratase